MLKTHLIPTATGVYQYPSLIKSLMLFGHRYEKGHEIVYRGQVCYSYATFNECVTRLANILSEAGVKTGGTVTVMDWDSHRYLECMFAILMIGAVLHTINIRFSPEQVLYTMNRAEDRFVLVSSEFVPLYQAVAGRLATVERTILLTDGTERNAELPDLVGEYKLLLTAASPRYDFPGFDESSIATTFYVAGATGNPKGVYFSHRQLILHTLVMASTIGSLDDTHLLDTSDMYMPITPMFYVHAWGTPCVAIMLGVKQVYPGRYDLELLVELRKRERVTFSHYVPVILQMVANARAAQGVGFKDWKVIIGGSALNHSLYGTARARGIQLTAAYGTSETCPLISYAYLNDELLAGSGDGRTTCRIKAGVSVPLADATIIDEQGRFLPADDEPQDELALRSSWLTQGHFREPERSEELWRGGWIRTGGVTTLNGTGLIEVRNHIKDMIRAGGEWLSSLELKDLINRRPTVREVAVAGVPNPQWGGRPFALLVVREDQQLSARGLKEHLKSFVKQGNVNKWAVPSQIAVVTDIPRTNVGRLGRKRIRIEITQRQETDSAFLSII